MEALGYTLAVNNLGTPGEINSCGEGNSAPAITGVKHDPPLPPAGSSVRVVAEVHDPDGLSTLTLNVRFDPNTNYTAVAMTNNGAGLYSAVLPGQASGTTAAFFIQAADNFAPPASALFPNDAPVRECLIRWGDTEIPGTLGTYRMWITEQVIQQWDDEEKMSNKPKDVTFIYNTERIIYNAGSFFHGSPFHSPAYNSPVGSSADYDYRFPVDDRLLGETDINLFRPGNGGGDSTGQREIHGYWFGHQFGVPYLYHRPVFLYVNGQRRQTIYHDAQQPNGDYVRQWYPDDADGELHKIKLGFEFGDQAYGNGEEGFSVVGANLRRYTTTGGEWKVARYRQTWPLRSVPPTQQNSYSNIFALVEAVNTFAPLGSEEYTQVLSAATDVEEWYSVHVTQHLYHNRDSFSYGGGQNAFAYRPERSPWQLFLWDIDFAFTGDASDPNLTGIGGADHGPRNTHPTFGRLYWQLLLEAANGMMSPERSGAILDSRFNGMQAAGANVASQQPIKDFIAARRAVIFSQAAANQFPFAITSNNGNPFNTIVNRTVLRGTAPLEVHELLVNGVAYPIHWTSLSEWETVVPLVAGANDLQVTGNDRKGNPVAGVSGSIVVTYTGTPELPEENIVISEIMYDPVINDGAYVEIYNRSDSAYFDLSGWRLNGVDFVFANGTLIGPEEYVVVAESESVVLANYGGAIRVVGEYDGRLDRGGERLTLIKPGATPAEDLIVDRVTYDNELPWPPDEPFLQVIDVDRDNARVSNWAGGSGWRFFSFTGRIGATRLFLFLDEAGDVYIDNLSVVTGAVAGVGVNLIENGDFEAPFAGPWSATGSHSGSDVSTNVSFLGSGSLHIVATAAGGAGAAVIQDNPAIDRNGTYTMSFWFLPRPGDLKLTARFGSGFRPEIDTGVVEPTPGAVNSVATSLPSYPELWLNEVQMVNVGGVMDNAGEREPWIELHNSGPGVLVLDDHFLSDDLNALAKWTFPAGTMIGPGEFKVIWIDGEEGESTATDIHAGFRLSGGDGSVALSRMVSGLPQVLDFLRYAGLGDDQSFGAFPDGQVFDRSVFLPSTPGAPNELPPVNVVINEWMAANDSAVRDPADDDFDDWFELYNPGPFLADLSGFYLSDDLSDSTQWRIPAGTTIVPGGFLLVWADDETGQNGGPGTDLHAGFRLSQAGESIGLWTPEGQLVDGVTFSNQVADVSEGLLPDGSETVVTFAVPSPGASNMEEEELVVSIVRFGGQVELTFPSVPGASYRIEFKDELSDPLWIARGTVVAGDVTMTVMDLIEGETRFYRVVRIP